jgi:hypothetical protein
VIARAFPSNGPCWLSSCDEGLGPRPGEDHAPDRGIRLDPSDCISQLGEHCGVERVQFVGTIDGDAGDTGVELEQKCGGHWSQELGVGNQELGDMGYELRGPKGN